MVSICKYSTLIFAGNVTVLLIVSMSTDYWEYRGFDVERLNKTLRKSNATQVIVPKDTNSYIQILHFRTKTRSNPAVHYAFNLTMYQPPILVHKYYTYNLSNVPQELRENGSRAAATTIVLFVQYGNLFRDCDNLEGGVRKRLGLFSLYPQRCYSFLTQVRRGDAAKDTPAAKYLERAAFAFSLLCLTSMMSACVTGAYGSFCRSKDSLMASSATSLSAGVCLTFTIALFNGKCHLLRRRELVLGQDVPFKELINDARTYSYGWSFVLAWICVALCFVSSYVWLHKSQYLGYPKKSQKDYLLPGVCLAFTIALFNGKCHLLRRRELILGQYVPFKEVINDARTYSYGWSFVLAWICVALCFVLSYVWLHKSQYLGYPKKSQKDYFLPGRLRRNVQFAYREGFD